MDARIVGVSNAAQGLGGEGAGKIGEADQVAGVEGGQRAYGCHGLRTVYEGEAFLRGKDHGLEARGREGLGAAHPAAAVESFAHAAEDESQVGQGREVARGAQRALFGYHRHDAGVQHRDEGGHGRWPDPRAAHREGVRPEEGHGANDLFGEWIAYAAGVAHDEVALQCGVIVLRDHHVAELAEARRDAVAHEAIVDAGVHDRSRLCHAFQGVAGDGDLGTASGDPDHVIQGERTAVYR